MYFRKYINYLILIMIHKLQKSKLDCIQILNILPILQLTVFLFSDCSIAAIELAVELGPNF